MDYGEEFDFNCTFTTLAGEHEDDKDGQEAWFTARIASLIG